MTQAAAHLPLLDARFVLLDAIGAGGMGAVFRAFDREAERIVALKVLHRAALPGPAHPLAEEFSAWASLRHPNVVRAYALAHAGSGPLGRGTPYLVLEHFAGLPAHRAFGASPPAGDEIEALARGVLRALDHVHGSGIVHRDLKPGNVLVSRRGSRRLRVKLTDFGLAAASGARRVFGRVSGSLAYVAPESVLGRPLDGRSDLYGLGILLWLLACRRLPFDSRDPAEVLRWHVEGETPDPRRVAPDLPERFARFVLRLTERDPARRFATAGDALEVLGARRRGPNTGGLAAVSAERAALRLALDAARLGAWRVWRAPERWSRSAVVVRDGCLAAQVHGVAVHRLRGPGGDEALSRLVLRLLLDRGPEIRRVVARHGLQRGIPLGFFGGLPVWDRMREHGSELPRDEASRRAIARGIAAFLAEEFRRRTTVLVAEPAALANPLTRDVVDRLVAGVDDHEPGGPGGLLLVLPRGSRSVAGRAASDRDRLVRAAPRLGGSGRRLPPVLPEAEHQGQQREADLVDEG